MLYNVYRASNLNNLSTFHYNYKRFTMLYLHDAGDSVNSVGLTTSPVEEEVSVVEKATVVEMEDGSKSTTRTSTASVQ